PVADIGSVMTSDNCGGAVTVTFVCDVISAQTCANRYIITRTYKATHLCFPTRRSSDLITVDDETLPGITCPLPVTVQCASLVPVAGEGTGMTSDHGDGAVAVTFVSDVISAQTCANRYTITRTYKATDVCGNFATCTQVI